MHKWRSYGLDKLNLWPFYSLTVKCVLDLQSTWTNVSNGTFTPQGEQLCQISLKSMHKCLSMAWTSLIYDHFIIWPSSVTLTFNLPKKRFKGTSSPQGEQLCQIILKYMHKCRSYGPDKVRWTHTCTIHTHTRTPNWNCNNYLCLAYHKHAHQKRRRSGLCQK